MNNVDKTGPVKINTRTYFRSGKGELRNPADTFSYVFIGSALAADRNVTLPLLASNDTLTFDSFATTLSNKTLDATCNVTAATGGSVTDAQYVTLATHAGLSAERTLAVGDGLTLTDAGANSAATINGDIMDRARKRVQIYDDFFGSTVTGTTPWAITPTGTVAAINVAGNTETGVYGVWALETGTDTTGSASIRAGNAASFALGQGVATFEAYIKIPTLSTAGEEFITRVGFGDSSTGLSTDAVCFTYNRLTSVNWIKTTISNTTATNTASTTAVGTGWTRLTIVVNAAGTSADFLIAGSSVGTIATNIPTGATRQLTVLLSITKSAGSTMRNMNVDYVAFDYDLTTARI